MKMSKNKMFGENENKLLSEVTCSKRTGNISLPPFRCPVRTATTSG